jgi:tetratricopeptide (TPR) repeat protein
MPQPKLSLVSEAAAQLSRDISDAPTDALWHVQGHSTSGKSMFLRLVAEDVRKKGFTSCLLAPPTAALDSGPIALVDIGASLKHGGLMNGDFDSIKDPSLPWGVKLERVQTAINKNADQVVLLCDDPLDWIPRNRRDAYFSQHTHDVINLISKAQCRKIIAGRTPSPLRSLPKRPLALPANSELEWVENYQEWGALAESAHRLFEAIGQQLAEYSPLEIRLLIAHAAVTSAEKVKKWLSEEPSRREISRRLAYELSVEPRFAPLVKVWAQLALLRRPFTESALDLFGVNSLSAEAAAIVKECLLFKDQNQFFLHDTLRLDASWNDWLSQGEERTCHGSLARYYAAGFKSSLTQEPLPKVLMLEMEAFHHAIGSHDKTLYEAFSPFFTLHLDALGKELSKAERRYAEAVSIFERVLKWDPNDDYAHHYLAFNLEKQELGKDPGRIENEYRAAVQLKPDQVWWRSRLISFLITEGRIPEARKEWDNACDALLLPNDDTWIYENLHLWVIPLLLRRGLLEFCLEVLGQIPEGLRRTHPAFLAADKRLFILSEARKNRSVFPIDLDPDKWWKGPHLCPHGKSLLRWMPGRVDAMDGSTIRIFVADKREGVPARFGYVAFKKSEFKKWLQDDEDGKKVSVGRFVEIAEYKDSKTPRIIRLHREYGHIDKNLPWPELDPTRYLKDAIWE